MSNLCTLKISIKDNLILSNYDDLKTYFCEINWDQPKIFQSRENCNEYLFSISRKIIRILKNECASYDSEFTNSRFLKFTNRNTGNDIIIIRIDYNVDITVPNYIALVTDYGETCDGHPQLLNNKKFFFREDAIKEIHDDMIDSKQNNAYEFLDFDKLEIWEDKDSVGQHGTTYTVSKL